MYGLRPGHHSLLPDLAGHGLCWGGGGIRGGLGAADLHIIVNQLEKLEAAKAA